MFEKPSIQRVELDGKVYDRVVMAGAPSSGRVGHPALPAKGARILLPYGTEVEKVEVITSARHGIGSGYLVEPVEQPFSLSTPPHEIPALVVDSVVYAGQEPIPEERHVEVGIQTFRGYRILVLKLNPVEYVPATGELSYYPEIRVRVTTVPSDGAPPPLRRKALDEKEVSAWIDNPGELSTYGAAQRQGASNYDLLIITSSSLVSGFQPLKDYHDSTGVPTEIHTLDQIGASDPHSVRDYIRQEYLDNGIQYVLIGGDDNLIPALDLYVVSWDGPGAVAEYNMPGDFYFSCLDGTFNYDGDGRWGEPTDGEGGGDIDLFPDVHVGRASVESALEAAYLISKTISYLGSEQPYLENVLLAGEQLRFGGLGEYGGYAMDEMVDGSDAHGFLTYAFPSAVYDIEKLYDLYSPPWNYWPPSDILSRINSGVHIVDHLGHSGGGYAMRTDTLMLMQQLSNTEYCFIYAEGCSAGKFDLMDCWAEFVTVRLEHGAFGCIANSRIGLGSRSTRHPVHVFNREFWDAIYHAEEAKPQLGRAISDARVDHVYHINDPGIRWNYYEINLFGDPAVAIKSVSSIAIRVPDGVPDVIPPDSATSFSVTVTGIGQGVPASGTGLLHYAVNQGPPVETAMDETVPNQYEATLPQLPCGDVVEFYVSVEDSAGRRFYEPSPDSPWVAKPVSEEVIIFQDDFETDQGWVISGGLWQRGIPLGQGGQEQEYPVPDPTGGCNGPRVMGYNLSGDYENNLTETHVTSPAIDCSTRDNVRLRFCRWLGVEAPAYDKARVLVSNNGSDWTMLWENGATIADLDWADIDYDISSVADSQPTVYLRWTMGPTDGGLRYIGWNIDDVRLVSLACPSYLCGNIDGVIGPGGPADVADLTFVVDYLFNLGPPPPVMEAANVDGITGPGGLVDVGDLTYLVAYLFDGGPEPVCE